MSIKKAVLLSMGFLSLGVGIVGIALPVLPTTPFILLSAICFSNSSDRFYQILRKNKYLGSYIDHYRNKSGVPTSIKMSSIVFLWAMLVLSMILFHKDYLFIILPIVGTCVTIHIALIKAKR